MNPYEAYYKKVSKHGTRTQHEDRLIEQIKLYGLQTPEREFRFHTERRWRFDFAYPEKKVALEVEGGVWSGGRHTRGYGFEEDCHKYNAAALHGWRVFRFTPKMIADLTAIKTVEWVLAHG